jgi:DNA segregation ATPase FtsK/SpoIIIE-like protein
MKGDSSLILPIANTREGFEQVVNMALMELSNRVRLFDATEGAPDNLDEYNQKATEPLPPIMLMLDEFSSVVLGMGGPKSDFAKRATEIAWRGLKFGIHVVLAGQDFGKDIVGPIREQMRTRLCFRVATADVSDVVIGRRGAERIRQPGRAMMPSGMVQTYLILKEALGRGAQGAQVSEAERQLLIRLVNEAEGRADLEKIMEFGGIAERQARRLREDWAARGLIEKRAERNNAWFVVQTLRASEPVQTTSERPSGVQAGQNI